MGMAAIDLTRLRGVVFDTDGVVTDTARVHAAAWKHVFDAFLRGRSVPFDIRADYLRYVDGRSRLDGVRAFLASRGICLPEGGPRDEPGASTVHGLGLAKDALFVQELAEHGVAAFGSTVDLASADPVLEVLEPEECLRLVAPAGVGRVAFNGSHGPTVLPVNYRLHDGAVVFRTAHGGPMDQDLSTGLEGVEIKIGFEVDRMDEAQREGWSVLIQGPAHHVPADELAKVTDSDVTPWAGGDRQL